MKTLIIGCGNMGRTFAESFLSAHLLRPGDIAVLDHHPEKLRENPALPIDQIYDRPGAFIGEYDLVILSVKPQDAAALFPLIRPYVHEGQTLLSVMAGLKMQKLSEALGCPRVIRAMPNLPSKIGMGMTAFTASEAVPRDVLLGVHNLLTTTGRAIYFPREEMLDAATAVSGSGPAFVYFFMNAMIKAASEMGFSESEAELLVWQTFNGAIHLQNQDKLTCNEWISKVASRGGTTEAALRIFSDREVENGIVEGLHAAWKRAAELGA